MFYRKQCQAFTLIELLVVISIIAVLAGMLLPAIGLVRDNARTSDCSSRMRQLAMVVQAYATDNDGWIPSSSMIHGKSLLDGDTGEGLQSYFDFGTLNQLQASKSIRCPEMARNLTAADVAISGYTPRDRFASNRRIWWNYAADGTIGDDNYMVAGVEVPPIKTLSAIAKPSQFFLVFCGNGGWYAQTGSGVANRWRPNFIHRGGAVSEQATDRYLFTKGRVNVTFGDGHVESLSYGGSSNNVGDKAIPVVSGGSSNARFEAGWNGK